MKTTENNKLIAEFMGVKLDNEFWSANFQYYTSWDWLMPVMKKIEDINGKVFITTSLEANYNMVVEYIKWYNENNKN